MSKPICYHPEIYPTQWEQKRPEPTEMIVCNCGKNQSCPTCGYGTGCFPCDCVNISDLNHSHAEVTHEKFFGENINRVKSLFK